MVEFKYVYQRSANGVSLLFTFEQKGGVWKQHHEVTTKSLDDLINHRPLVTKQFYRSPAPRSTRGRYQRRSRTPPPNPPPPAPTVQLPPPPQQVPNVTIRADNALIGVAPQEVQQQATHPAIRRIRSERSNSSTVSSRRRGPRIQSMSSRPTRISSVPSSSFFPSPPEHTDTTTTGVIGNPLSQPNSNYDSDETTMTEGNDDAANVVRNFPLEMLHSLPPTPAMSQPPTPITVARGVPELLLPSSTIPYLGPINDSLRSPRLFNVRRLFRDPRP
jgi:hypothetical protein